MIDIDSKHLVDFVEFTKRKRAKRNKLDWHLYHQGFNDRNEKKDRELFLETNFDKSFHEKKMQAVLGIPPMLESLDKVNCDTHSEEDSITSSNDDEFISDLTKNPPVYGKDRNIMMFLIERITVFQNFSPLCKLGLNNVRNIMMSVSERIMVFQNFSPLCK